MLLLAAIFPFMPHTFCYGMEFDENPAIERQYLIADIPVTINGHFRSNILLKIYVEENEVQILDQELPTEFQEALLPVALDQVKECIKNSPLLDGEHTLAVSDGINIAFDSYSQEMTCNIAPEYLATAVHSIRSRTAIAERKKETPQSTCGASAYLNVVAGQKFYHSYYSDFQLPGQQTFGDLELVVNMQEWVLQSFLYYVGDTKRGLNRGNVLLTHDIPQKDMRVSFGDVNSLGFGFQGTVPMIGVNLHKNKELFTDPTVGPISRYDFFLNVPSKVEVLLDNVPLKTLELPAGSHQISDFPIVEGLNSIVLRITSPTGEVRTIDVNYFYNPHFLPKGQSEYSATFGIPTYKNQKANPNSTTVEKIFNTYSQPVTFSGQYRIGVRDNVTLGAYLQANIDQFFLGTECNFVAKEISGVFDLGTSFVTEDYFGYRARLALFSKIFGPKSNPVNWRATLEYIGKKFGFFGEDTNNFKPYNNRRMVAAAQVNTRVFKDLSASVMGEYGFERTGNDSQYYQITLQKPLGAGFTARFIGSRSKDYTGTTENVVVASLDLIPKNADWMIRNNYNSRQRTFESTGTYRKHFNNNQSIMVSAGYSKAPSSQIATGKASFEGNRGSVNASHYLAKQSATDVDSTARVTNVNLGTSLVLANKRLSVSRPINDSFVMICADKGVRGYPLLINPASAENYRAVALRQLPAVIPVTSYRKQEITVAAPSLPFGRELRKDHFVVYPSYKSGTLISVTAPISYALEGILKTEDGRVIQQMGGILYSAEDSTDSYSFFTNINGSFEIIGVTPGDYFLQPYDLSVKPMKIHVQQHIKGGILDLGVLKMKVSKYHE